MDNGHKMFNILFIELVKHLWIEHHLHIHAEIARSLRPKPQVTDKGIHVKSFNVEFWA